MPTAHHRKDTPLLTNLGQTVYAHIAAACVHCAVRINARICVRDGEFESRSVSRSTGNKPHTRLGTHRQHSRGDWAVSSVLGVLVGRRNCSKRLPTNSGPITKPALCAGSPSNAVSSLPGAWRLSQPAHGSIITHTLRRVTTSCAQAMRQSRGMLFSSLLLSPARARMLSCGACDVPHSSYIVLSSPTMYKSPTLTPSPN